ncbi:MAG: hybrid sensor histidine kinase/response regulator, partial [Lachnospiraceae bacterium]|nr:hybrid sensor histidine kinase/response regulator [Lachnospiraceae bacterium]
MKNSILIIRPALLAVILGLLIFLSDFTAFAEDDINDKKDLNIGGGYAVTNQIDNVGYTAELYDATNGLPTSDANYILGTRDGYLWIGGYSGIIRYDGTEFERLDTSDGLTSGRCIYEDSKNRVWVGTNDGGVVMIDKEERTSFTYKDGLPSSSIRSFAEDKEGNIFVGTTAGVAYIDSDMNVNVIDDSRINEERILKLEADDEGDIYCQTANGIMFTINNYKVDKLFNSDELNLEKITTFLLDP